MKDNTRIKIKLIETMCDAIISEMFNANSVKSFYDTKSDTLDIKLKKVY